MRSHAELAKDWLSFANQFGYSFRLDEGDLIARSPNGVEMSMTNQQLAKQISDWLKVASDFKTDANAVAAEVLKELGRDRQG